MARFEKIKEFAAADLPIPVRKTKNSAGYDFAVAETTVIPSYSRHFLKMLSTAEEGHTYTLDAVARMTKELKAKPTLVPTGVKCYLDDNQYLELSVRSSSPLKYWLILANGVGIIDADYVDNPDNEGHIYFQLINLSPYNIVLHKGEIIGQGIIKNYETVENDTPEREERVGGFGSTTAKNLNLTDEQLKEMIMSLGQSVSL